MLGKKNKSSNTRDKLFEMKDTGKELFHGGMSLAKAGVGIAVGAAALGIGVQATQKYI